MVAEQPICHQFSDNCPGQIHEQPEKTQEKIRNERKTNTIIERRTYSEKTANILEKCKLDHCPN